MADGWCDNEKGVGETGGMWWKDREKASISTVNIDIDGRNTHKYGNNGDTWKMKRRMEFSLCFGPPLTHQES